MLLRSSKTHLTGDPDEAFLPVFVASIVDRRPAADSIIFSVADVVSISEIRPFQASVFPGAIFMGRDLEGYERTRLEYPDGAKGPFVRMREEMVPGFAVMLRGDKLIACMQADYLTGEGGYPEPRERYEAWREALMVRRDELVGYWSRLLARTVAL